jgi:hypothetical protein
MKPSKRSRPVLALVAIALAIVAAGCITPSDPRLDDSSRIDARPMAMITRSS